MLASCEHIVVVVATSFSDADVAAIASADVAAAATGTISDLEFTPFKLESAKAISIAFFSHLLVFQFSPITRPQLCSPQMYFFA